MVANRQIGVHELKDNLSAYLRQVKASATVTITEHEQSISRLTPVRKSVEERLQELADSGLITRIFPIRVHIYLSARIF